MVDFHGVTKRYGAQIVLDDVSFRFNPGEHIGIVGPNGAGKTTIFSLIVGEMEPDSGNVQLPNDCRLGYVRQHAASGIAERPLLDHVEAAVPELLELEKETHAIEARLEDVEEPTKTQLLARLGEVQTRFEALGGYNMRPRAEQALSGLGFDEAAFQQPIGSFSGGWQSRAELARVLVAEPEVLLLDEPSNYLDIPTIEWLQRYLREFRGTLLLISHDRYLLNALTSVTLEVSGGEGERYSGNYDAYVSQRELRYEQRLAAQKNEDRRREQIESFVTRFRAKSTKAAQVQSKIKMLERMERVERPRRLRSPGTIRLRPPPHSGVEVMRLDEAGLSYDGSRWVLRHLDLRITRGEKIVLVGLNGLGKTTLLRMLSGVLPLSEGRRVVGHKVVMGYQSQDFAETMNPRQTVYEAVKSVAADVPDQEVRTLLGGFGFSGESIDKPIQVLSGGEKIRVAFARLLIKPPNFLLLDEPTTHLDIQAREALEKALSSYSGTLCLVTHDVDFARKVATSVIAMTPPGITAYAGGYDYYRERVDQAPRQVSAARASSNTQKSAVPAPGDKKALRRERAREREEKRATERHYKQIIRKAEKRIELMEGEKAQVLNALSSPDPETDFGTLNRRLKDLQDEIDYATRQWEAAAEEMGE
ncbi:MAG: ABC-F family ATP-binding cassette domain-containing protein [Kiritimatiellae bacterium]|nr:ABC-F family ATP-binding cassette domain-containing protein [Kiritimatiellia bacterium]